MKLIEQWLQGGQPYNIGVKLYLMYGADVQLKRLLSTEGETAFKKQQLAAALRQLVQPAPLVGQPEMTATGLSGNPIALSGNLTALSGNPSPKDNTPTTHEVFAKQWPSSLNKDDVLKGLHEQARLLLKEIASMHASLLHLPDDERKQTAFALLRKDDDLDALYYQRDYYLQHGRLPDQPGFELIADPLLAAQRIANLKRYIRREKLAVKKDAGNVGAIARLKAFEDEMNAYKVKFGKEAAC